MTILPVRSDLIGDGCKKDWNSVLSGGSSSHALPPRVSASEASSSEGAPDQKPKKKPAGLQPSTKGKGKKNKKDLDDEDDEPMDPNHTPIQGGKNNDDDEEDDILDDIPDDLAPPPGASKKRPAAQPRVQKRPASRHRKQDDKVGFTVHRSFG